MRSALAGRLSAYWRMELGNVILIPLLLVFWTDVAGGRVGWVGLLTMLAMMAMLVVGGLYWRAKLHQLLGNPDTLARFLPVADRAQGPLAMVCAGAATLAALSWLRPGISLGLGDRVVASIAGALALAEYVNYYHRQLQHFDHWADLRRLLRGRGFRPSKLSRDLARHRAAASTGSRP